MTMPDNLTFLATVTSPSIMAGAGKVALVVGLVLNAINQGPAIWQGADISWWHMVLNFVVPFCVSSYSAARNQMTRRSETGDE